MALHKDIYKFTDDQLIELSRIILAKDMDSMTIPQLIEHRDSTVQLRREMTRRSAILNARLRNLMKED